MRHNEVNFMRHNNGEAAFCQMATNNGYEQWRDNGATRMWRDANSAKVPVVREGKRRHSGLAVVSPSQVTVVGRVEWYLFARFVHEDCAAADSGGKEKRPNSGPPDDATRSPPFYQATRGRPGRRNPHG